MVDTELRELGTETEKYYMELLNWLEVPFEGSRVSLYKKIDTYPISNIAKMHLARIIVVPWVWGV